MNPSDQAWGPGGSPQARELSQFIANWEKNLASSLKAKLQACGVGTPAAAALAEQIAECSDVYSRLIVSGYAREDS